MTKQTCASKSKVALNAAFAAILAVGLSVPAASAFAAPSDDKQAEAHAALQKLNQYQSELDQASANYEAAHQEQIDAQNRVDEAPEADRRENRSDRKGSAASFRSCSRYVPFG